jgi:hypothetical protein
VVVATDLVTSVAEWSSILSLLGVGIAIWQLVRTRRSVSAARGAIERTEAHLAVNQLLVLIPQLQRLEPELNVALTTQGREAVIRHLAEWRRLAGDVYGLAKNQQYGDDELLGALQQSAASAALVKRRILDPKRDLLKTSAPALRDIDAACEALARLSGQLKRNSGGGPNGE